MSVAIDKQVIKRWKSVNPPFVKAVDAFLCSRGWTSYGADAEFAAFEWTFDASDEIAFEVSVRPGASYYTIVQVTTQVFIRSKFVSRLCERLGIFDLMSHKIGSWERKHGGLVADAYAKDLADVNDQRFQGNANIKLISDNIEPFVKRWISDFEFLNQNFFRRVDSAAKAATWIEEFKLQSAGKPFCQSGGDFLYCAILYAQANRFADAKRMAALEGQKRVADLLNAGFTDIALKTEQVFERLSKWITEEENLGIRHD
jgi:hypothetical protein